MLNCSSALYGISAKLPQASLSFEPPISKLRVHCLYNLVTEVNSFFYCYDRCNECYLVQKATRVLPLSSPPKPSCMFKIQLGKLEQQYLVINIPRYKFLWEVGSVHQVDIYCSFFISFSSFMFHNHLSVFTVFYWSLSI